LRVAGWGEPKPHFVSARGDRGRNEDTPIELFAVDGEQIDFTFGGDIHGHEHMFATVPDGTPVNEAG